MSEAQVPFDADYTLGDKYGRERRSVYITGVQALVRLPLWQAKDMLERRA